MYQLSQSLNWNPVNVEHENITKCVLLKLVKSLSLEGWTILTKGAGKNISCASAFLFYSFLSFVPFQKLLHRVASPESNYLESKFATEISRVELWRIEFYGALQQWYNMNEIFTSFDPR